MGFLNRVAASSWPRVRDFVEAAFEGDPDEHAQELRRTDSGVPTGSYGV